MLTWFEEKRFTVNVGPSAAGARLRAHPSYVVFVHLMFWSGMRPSEAAGLQRQDVDLVRGLVHVRRSRHLWEYGDTKTEGCPSIRALVPADRRPIQGVAAVARDTRNAGLREHAREASLAELPATALVRLPARSRGPRSWARLHEGHLRHDGVVPDARDEPGRHPVARATDRRAVPNAEEALRTLVAGRRRARAPEFASEYPKLFRERIVPPSKGPRGTIRRSMRKVTPQEVRKGGFVTG
jgi:integrase